MRARGQPRGRGQGGACTPGTKSKAGGLSASAQPAWDPPANEGPVEEKGSGRQRLLPHSARSREGPGSPRSGAPETGLVGLRSRRPGPGAVRPEETARTAPPAPGSACRVQPCFGCPLTRPWAHKGLLGASPWPSLPIAAKLMSPRQVGFTARPGSSRVENEPGTSREASTRAEAAWRPAGRGSRGPRGSALSSPLNSLGCLLREQACLRETS